MDNEKRSPVERLVEKLRRENPDIRPYAEDDWDWTWADEGLDLLDSGDPLLAEKKFQELIVAQPEHPDGYEGLALVYRELGRKDEAVMLIQHAVELARVLLAREEIDPGVLAELQAEQVQIEAM
jgi:tetratricopeptide (TPR) repeat protein